MNRALLLVAPAVVLLGCDPGAPTPLGPTEAAVSPQLSRVANGRGAAGVVYVRNQGLYYDTYATAETLPMHGRFQLLENDETDFGPGDRGYLGGRWWVDVNGNRIQDTGDRFFSCPLLPPGRPNP
jgi:hypothetical protein